MLYVLYCIRMMHCCDRSCKYPGEWASNLATQHSANSLYVANIHYLVMAAERCRGSIEVGVTTHHAHLKKHPYVRIKENCTAHTTIIS